jgi:hypothetical protein
LRAGDAEATHAAIEFRPQQPGHVGDHDANIFLGIGHSAVVSTLIGKLGYHYW